MAAFSGRFVTLIPQVRTSSKTLVVPVLVRHRLPAFGPPFTAAEGGPKGGSGFGFEAEAQCTARAGASFAGTVVRATAELRFRFQLAAKACGLRSSSALCGRTCL